MDFNTTQRRTRTTSRMKNVKIIHQETFTTVEEARKREIYFKTAAGRKYLKKVLNMGP